MDISRARKHLPLFSAILFSVCPLNFFRAIRAALQSPVGLKIFETSKLPASGSINRLDPGYETSAPIVLTIGTPRVASTCISDVIGVLLIVINSVPFF